MYTCKIFDPFVNLLCTIYTAALDHEAPYRKTGDHEVEVTVTTLEGVSFAISCSGHDTVTQLQTKVEARTGFHHARQQLFVTDLVVMPQQVNHSIELEESYKEQPLHPLLTLAQVIAFWLSPDATAEAAAVAMKEEAECAPTKMELLLVVESCDEATANAQFISDVELRARVDTGWGGLHALSLCAEKEKQAEKQAEKQNKVQQGRGSEMVLVSSMNGLQLLANPCPLDVIKIVCKDMHLRGSGRNRGTVSAELRREFLMAGGVPCEISGHRSAGRELIGVGSSLQMRKVERDACIVHACTCTSRTGHAHIVQLCIDHCRWAWDAIHNRFHGMTLF